VEYDIDWKINPLILTGSIRPPYFVFRIALTATDKLIHDYGEYGFFIQHYLMYIWSKCFQSGKQTIKRCK